MAFQAGLLRRVQASKRQDYSTSSAESEDEQDYTKLGTQTTSKVDRTSSSSGILDKNSDQDSEANDETLSSISDQEREQGSGSGPDPKSLLSTISFADLATAQASLGLSRKRKRNDSPSSASSPSRSTSPFHEAQERQAGKSKPKVLPNPRSSKHGPVEMSSKKAVSRKRTVIAASKIEARDPRFSDLSGGLNTNRIAQNYAFLDGYRADEIRDLKTQIRGTKDAVARERLKGELRAMEDRERARKKVEDEKAVVREHRKKEAEAVKKGKKPFYLKRADIKKQVLVKRFEDLGEKRAEKLMERKRKKKAAKQRKAMPNSRRDVG